MKKRSVADTDNSNIIVQAPLSLTTSISLSTTSNNAGIVIGANMTAPTITLTTNGTGSITNAIPSLISASALTLSSAAGNFGNGTGSDSLSIAAGSLTATTSGSVFINSTGALTLNATKAGTPFHLTNDTRVTVAGKLTATDVVISTPWLTNNSSVQPGASLTVQNTNGTLQLDGTGNILNPSGTTVFAATGSFTGVQGSITGNITGYAGKSFSLNTNSNQTIKSITAANGTLSLTSSGDITVTDSSVLLSTGNLSLSGRTGVTIGSTTGTGVTISAGVLAPGTGTSFAVLGAGSVISPGSVTIDSYAGGSGTGNITFGNNVNVSSRGGATFNAPGTVGVTSGGTITAGNGNVFTSWGGDVWFNAVKSILLGNAQISSIAKLDDNGSSITLADGTSMPAYAGGAVALWTGQITANPQTTLNGMVLARTNGDQTTITTNDTNSTDVINISNGSILTITEPLTKSSKTPITNTIITLNGGILAIQTQNANAPVTLNGAQFNVVAPPLPSSSSTGGTLSGAPPQADTTNAASPGLFQPIAFMDRIPGHHIALKSRKSSAGLIETVGDTALYADKTEDSVILEHGEILVGAMTDMQVKTADCKVKVRRGTVALVRVENRTLRLRNLYDTCAGGLQLDKGSVHQNVRAGEELIVTPSRLADHAAGSDSVGRRRIERRNFAGDTFIHCEVSFITTVKDSKVLSLVMQSKDSDNQAITSRMKKMAVCLAQVTAKHGNYGVWK